MAQVKLVFLNSLVFNYYAQVLVLLINYAVITLFLQHVCNSVFVNIVIAICRSINLINGVTNMSDSTVIINSKEFLIKTEEVSNKFTISDNTGVRIYNIDNFDTPRVI